MLIGQDGETKKLTLNDGRYYVSSTLYFRGDRIIIKFPFNRGLLREVKNMEGRKWHPDKKWWSVKNSPRNSFQLKYLAKEYDNPYEEYKHELYDTPVKEFYIHQHEMTSFCLERKSAMLACEMGLGKSLCWIKTIELLIENGTLPPHEPWYVGPVAGVKAVTKELRKWNAKFDAKMMTYQGLTKLMKTYSGVAPYSVCFDEFSKLKTHTSQRSQAARHLADSMRIEHENYRIIMLSGTPSPKSPIDWWHPCEVACPGYILEGHPSSFKKRMSLVEMRESQAGGQYPHLITWLDDEEKCARCGQIKLHPDHLGIENPDYHPWQKSVNEVANLYKRLNNLVLVRKKMDCTDLPEKQYEIIQIKPTVEILNMAKMIKKKSPRAITALIGLRELTDGFKYVETISNTKPCDLCKGTGIIKDFEDQNIDPLKPVIIDENAKKELVSCDNCCGTGEMNVYSTQAKTFGSPKDDFFKEDLDACEDIGRYCVWGGFTGTIDRLVELAHEKDWSTLRIDGRGYHGSDASGRKLDSDELLSAMDLSSENYEELRRKYPKLCVVGHPQAGGMALTLTATPVALYYSNCFDGEARMQSEDRGHRLGMDENRGYIIKDLFMLSTDKLVYDNLMQKKKLQNLTMGELHEA